MNKKYLIVSGDSFTKGHTLGEKGSWAYHVARKMNLQLVNLSNNGMGNEWISSTLLSFLYRHEPILNESIVMVGWTDFGRELNFYRRNINEYESFTDIVTTVPFDLHDDSSGGHRSDYFTETIIDNKKILKHFIGNDIVCLYKSYFAMLHTKTFCERYNIPFLFFDAVANNKLYYDTKSPYLLSFKKEKIYLDFQNNDISFLQDFNDRTFVDKIFNKKYINFEGNSIFQWISLPGNQIYEEGNPGHTNELGADLISDMILKQYENIYNK